MFLDSFKFGNNSSYEFDTFESFKSKIKDNIKSPNLRTYYATSFIKIQNVEKVLSELKQWGMHLIFRLNHLYYY